MCAQGHCPLYHVSVCPCQWDFHRCNTSNTTTIYGSVLQLLSWKILNYWSANFGGHEFQKMRAVDFVALCYDESSSLTPILKLTTPRRTGNLEDHSLPAHVIHSSMTDAFSSQRLAINFHNSSIIGPVSDHQDGDHRIFNTERNQ